MGNLNSKNIEKVIKEIATEAPNSKISQKSLTKFGTSIEDKIFLGCIEGESSWYLKALPLFIKKLNLKNIVELGNREGVSTLCIWDTLPHDARLTTIDIEKDQRYCPDDMFRDNRVDFVFGDVCDLEIFKNKIPFDIDFLFSDTIHYNFQVSDEFEIYQYLLADSALVAIDDININDKRLFFDKITYPKWDTTRQFHHSGWGFFLFERKEPMTKEERILCAYQASAKIWKRKHDELQMKLIKARNRNPIFVFKKIIKKIPFVYKIWTTTYNKYYAYRHPFNI